jgi:RNA polymerase sigma-70 factor (ECF subfamily)
VELAGQERTLASGLDEDTDRWLARLTMPGSGRETARRELHDRLLRIARHELRRRPAGASLSAAEFDELAFDAAGDAMLAILAKLPQFRGESRFTTWAYRFVVLEVSAKLGRRYWRDPPATLDSEQWERLPDRLGVDPQAHVEATAIMAVVRRVVDTGLTAYQRRVFVAIVVDGIPLDALAGRLGVRRGAIYKAVFDARRKIRRELVANGYLEEPGRSGDG